MAPAVLDRHEQERALRHPAEARLEEPDERQPQQTQLDALDPHRIMLSQGGRAARVRERAVTALL